MLFEHTVEEKEEESSPHGTPRARLRPDDLLVGECWGMGCKYAEFRVGRREVEEFDLVRFCWKLTSSINLKIYMKYEIKPLI